MENNSKLAEQSESIIDSIADLDTLIDELSARESANLLEVYKSINIILKAQKVMLSKNGLRLIKD